MYTPGNSQVWLELKGVVSFEFEAGQGQHLEQVLKNEQSLCQDGEQHPR